MCRALAPQVIFPGVYSTWGTAVAACSLGANFTKGSAVRVQLWPEWFSTR